MSGLITNLRLLPVNRCGIHVIELAVIKLSGWTSGRIVVDHGWIKPLLLWCAIYFHNRLNSIFDHLLLIHLRQLLLWFQHFSYHACHRSWHELLNWIIFLEHVIDNLRLSNNIILRLLPKYIAVIIVITMLYRVRHFNLWIVTFSNHIAELILIFDLSSNVVWFWLLCSHATVISFWKVLVLLCCLLLEILNALISLSQLTSLHKGG